MMELEAGEGLEGTQEGVKKAEKRNLTNEQEVDNAAGQNVGQMLDTLKVLSFFFSLTPFILFVYQALKRRRASLPKSDIPIVIKGILSTSQDNLFFNLRDRGDNELPQLEFIGRFTVKIFERETGRTSGHEKGEELDRSDIEQFLKNLYCFLLRD